MSPSTQSPAVICAENIALSYFLAEVQNPPLRNPVSSTSDHDEGYILPFSKERKLAEILSFLAKPNDKPTHIPAICIEQASSGSHLNVLLAINKSTWSDGNVILRDLKEKLEEIFKVLKEAQYGPLIHSWKHQGPEIEKAVFRAIINMCSSRILCRLGLAPGWRKEQKKPINETLKDARASLQRLGREKLRSLGLMATYEGFMGASKRAIKLVNIWSNDWVASRIGDLVDGIHRLGQLQKFNELVNLLSHMDSSQRKSLVDTIGKVARYRDAARILYRVAKKYPVTRNMQIEPVNLPQAAFDRARDPGYTPSLQTLLSRIGFINGHKPSESQAYQTNKQISPDSFLKTTRQILTEAKIHAEIQLLAFCDIRAPELYPRVISSSKDACFLCNQFIGLHGKMHTCRSHGRLYHGWRLPPILQFKSLQHKFNDLLMGNIRQLLGDSKRTKLPYPNESTLLTLSISATTQSTIQGITEIDKEPDAPDEAQTKASPNVVMSARSGDRSLEIETSPNSRVTTSSDSVAEYIVKEGFSQRRIFKPGQRSPFFVSKSLAVQVELDDMSSMAARSPSPGYSIEWATPESMEKSPDNSLVVYPEFLYHEETHALPEDRSVCIVVNDVMLR
ncbi:uncharacterized protein N7459_001164, partial [Penicillium hispanicum]|uniref:uncharacterized protein n=1 Tax=Penicillium hispanicum TaxID=1080232 RepID=UPI0025405813